MAKVKQAREDGRLDGVRKAKAQRITKSGRFLEERIVNCQLPTAEVELYRKLDDMLAFSDAVRHILAH